MRSRFKTSAEELSEEQRKGLGIRINEALPARLLAEKLDIKVLGVEDIPGLAPSHVEHLLNGDISGWSAFTVEVDSRRFVVHNTVHAPTRQESNIMHELAHILCEHPSGQVIQIAGLFLRHYDPLHEEEAVWLGGALQIPRKALLWAGRQGMANIQIADRFGASVDLVRYRMNATGVMKQLARERSSRNRR